jgi:hypothetical protein
MTNKEEAIIEATTRLTVALATLNGVYALLETVGVKDGLLEQYSEARGAIEVFARGLDRYKRRETKR